MKYYTFNNREDFERVLDAVRTVERLDRQGQLPAPPTPVGIGAGVVVIKVTGPRVGSGTEPSGAVEIPSGEELADETDYYPARPYYFNPVDKSYFRGVESPTSEEDKCYAHGLNDEDLEEDNYYLGFVSGYANGFAVVKAVVAMGGGGQIWVQITGGTDAGGYSGKRVKRTTGNTWVDATEPTPLTWASKIWRAPSSSAANLPAIPSGQVVRCWPSPVDATHLETDGVGGRQSVTVVSNVACVAGNIVVTTKTLTGRDLSLV